MPPISAPSSAAARVSDEPATSSPESFCSKVCDSNGALACATALGHSPPTRASVRHPCPP